MILYHNTTTTVCDYGCWKNPLSGTPQNQARQKELLQPCTAVREYVSISSKKTGFVQYLLTDSTATDGFRLGIDAYQG